MGGGTATCERIAKARHLRALNGTRLTDQRRFSTWFGGKSSDQWAQFGQDLVEGPNEGSIHGATSRIFMSSAAQLLGNGGNVDPSFAAQAHADALFGQLAQKDGGLDIGKRKRIVHNAFTILFGGTGAHHVVVGDPKPGQPSFAVQVVERRA